MNVRQRTARENTHEHGLNGVNEPTGFDPIAIADLEDRTSGSNIDLRRLHSPHVHTFGDGIEDRLGAR